jgi:hypothetical protein
VSTFDNLLRRIAITQVGAVVPATDARTARFTQGHDMGCGKDRPSAEVARMWPNSSGPVLPDRPKAIAGPCSLVARSARSANEEGVW